MTRALSILLLLSQASLASDAWFTHLLPASTTSVTGVDVRRLKQAPSGAMLLSFGMPIDWRFPEIGEFNAWTDLEEILFCETADGELTLVRGEIGFAQLASLHEPDGETKLIAYQGVPVSTANAGSIWAAGLGGYAIIGQSGEVRAAIERHQARLVVLDPALRRRLAQLRDSGEIWFWTGKMDPYDWLSAVGSAPHAPGSAVVRLGDTIAARLEWEAQSADAAEAVAQAIRRLAEVDSASRLERRLWRALRVSLTGRRLSVELTLPHEEFVRMVTIEQRLHHRHPPPPPPPVQR